MVMTVSGTENLFLKVWKYTNQQATENVQT